MSLHLATLASTWFETSGPANVGYRAERLSVTGRGRTSSSDSVAGEDFPLPEPRRGEEQRCL